MQLTLIASDLLTVLRLMIDWQVIERCLGFPKAEHIAEITPVRAENTWRQVESGKEHGAPINQHEHPGVRLFCDR